MLLQQLDRNRQKRVSCDFMSLSLSCRLISLAFSAFEKREQIAAEKKCCFLGYSTLFFSWEYFSCQAKRLWRTDDITSCWTLPPLQKVCQASLSVSFCLSPTSPQFSLCRSGHRKFREWFTGVYKSESMIQWHWMFSHLLGMYTGEHRHISIKTTAGG